MPEVEHQIPLFPLNLVLFPESRIRLHIYEEHYCYMIQMCLEQDRRFGINLVEESTMHPIGCSARVLKKIRTFPDGSFDVIVEGESRYEIADYSKTDHGYLQGSVRFIRDEEEETSEGLVHRSMELFNEMLDIAYPGKQAPEPLQRDESQGGLSYFIAEKSGMEAEQKQTLLETVSETERLVVLVDHMEEMIPKLVKTEKIRRLVANDGYLPR